MTRKKTLFYLTFFFFFMLVFKAQAQSRSPAVNPFREIVNDERPQEIVQNNDAQRFQFSPVTVYPSQSNKFGLTILSILFAILLPVVMWFLILRDLPVNYYNKAQQYQSLSEESNVLGLNNISKEKNNSNSQKKIPKAS